MTLGLVASPRAKKGSAAPRRVGTIHDDFAAREALILDTAIGEFCERGYDAVSIQSIAAAAGVSAGLLYKHFDGKEHLLYKAIAHRYCTQVDAFLVDIAAVQGGPHERLRRFIELHLSSWRDTPQFNLLFFHETRRASHPYSHIVGVHARTYVHCLEDILRAGIAAGEFSADIDVRFIRDFLIGGLDHSVWWAVASGHAIDVPALTDQAIGYLLPNILVRPAGRDAAP